MLRQTPLVSGEIYHVFNRGAHKRNIFTCGEDYARYQLGIHLANHSSPIIVRDVVRSPIYSEPFEYPSDKSLVDVLAYSLMPNHFHIALRQKVDSGISLFMKKLNVGYSMYFNLRHAHSGTLSQGPFKSRHIDSDSYFKWIFTYIHLNPIVLVEPEWKKGQIADIKRAWKHLEQYRYSSFYDYYVHERPERIIMNYPEALGYVDREGDIVSMLAGYSRGRGIFSED